MEAIDLKFQNLRENIARMLGSRSRFDSKSFVSSNAWNGEYSTISKFPSYPVAPIQNLITGGFKFLVDYDGIDNGNPIE